MTSLTILGLQPLQKLFQRIYTWKCMKSCSQRTTNMAVMTSRAVSSYSNFLEQTKILTWEKNSVPWGFFLYTCMAAISLLCTTIGNLRTTTTTSSTTTGSEIQCTAQARLANFVVVVSSTTPNTAQSRRPASQASAGMNPLFWGDFLSVLCIFLSS